MQPEKGSCAKAIRRLQFLVSGTDYTDFTGFSFSLYIAYPLICVIRVIRT
ncbi:hypothetical protein HMPREF9445_00077 [Bacteroides clarus YIT 12056]|uniref:Uncharacterized protein n=1 Tax=Bacteroides clarus YIT 12056 TaxID=762984 RepID=A0ABN0CSX5_9BACE|nr:hypothetical protein HMPREF9445_00077 [Bacteroides clarus YIT 12056]